MKPRHLIQTVTSEMGPGTLERAPSPTGCYYGWNLNMLLWKMGKCPWPVMMQWKPGLFLVRAQEEQAVEAGTHVDRCLLTCLAKVCFFLSCPDQQIANCSLSLASNSH